MSSLLLIEDTCSQLLTNLILETKFKFYPQNLLYSFLVCICRFTLSFLYVYITHNHLFIFTQLYLQAITLCNATYGEVSVLSGRLHNNMAILYDDRDDYNEAYDWYVKSGKIREKVGTIQRCHE